MKTVSEEQGDTLPRWRLLLWDGLVGGISLLAVLPLGVVHVPSLWSRPHMIFFPLVWAVVLFVSITSLRQEETRHRPRRLAAIWLLAINGLIYALSVWNYSPWLAYMAGIGIFLAWALGRLGNTPVPTVLAIGLFLATTQVWPVNSDTAFISWLETVAADYCSATLDAFSVPNLVADGKLRTEQIQIAIGQLSGWVSIYLLFALSVAVCLFRHRSALHGVLLFLSCPFWNVLGNYVVMLLAVYLKSTSSIDILDPTNLLFSRLGLFLFCVACVCMADLFLSAMLTIVPMTDPEFGGVFAVTNKLLCWPQPHLPEIPIPEDPEELEMFEQMQLQDDSEEEPPPDFVWQQVPLAKISVLAIVLLIVLVAIPPTIIVARNQSSSSNLIPRVSEDVLSDFLVEDSLPPNVGPWQQKALAKSIVDRKNLAKLEWSYKWRGQTVYASLTFPHLGWSSVDLSTTSAGWRPIASNLIRSEDADGWSLQISQYVNSLGGKIYDCNCAMTDDLQPVESNDLEEQAGRQDQPRSKIAQLLSPAAIEPRPVSYVLAVKCESGGDMTEKELEEFIDTFELFREAVKQALAPGQLKSLSDME